MKILQISNRVPWPLNEGGTIGIYNFTKAFAEAGHKVSLLCLDGIKHQTPISAATSALGKYCKRLYIHPIDTELRKEDALKDLLKRRSYNVSRFDNEAFAQHIKDLLEKEKFDVVQMEGTYTGPYVDLVREYHEGLISMRMHNVEHEIWERLSQNESNPIKSIYLKTLSKQLKRYEKNLLSKIDLLVTVTADDASKFKELDSSVETMVIPAGIDIEHWTFTPSNNYNNWFHLGSLEWKPNQEGVRWFLKEIWPGLRKLQALRFHLAGKGINATQYTGLDGVEAYSHVEDAYDFVSRQDICVVPLLSGSGIRLKILEAMSAGKLVISTTVGAQGLETIPGEHLLIADSMEDFKGHLEEMRSGQTDIQNIAEAARKLVESKYSIKAVSARLLERYAKA